MLSFRLSELVKGFAVGLETVALRIMDSEEKAVAVHRHRVSVPLNNISPKIERKTFIAPNSSLIGKVSLGHETSVGWGTVIRGDHTNIQIGNKTSIGDHVILSSLPDSNFKFHPIEIGDEVCIGTGTVFSGGKIGEGCFIDTGCNFLPNVTMEPYSAVGPASVVLSNTVIKTGEYWTGNPATRTRDLTDEEKESLTAASEYYRRLTNQLVKTLEWIEHETPFPDKFRTHELYADASEEKEQVEKMK